jgi:O-antigen/teichoic acid export membrane protein
MSGMLFLNISIFIIFDKYELSSLTLYLLLIQIIGILSNLTTIKNSTIKPHISKYHAENDWASIQKVFLSGLKYIALFSFLFSFYSYF